MSARQDTSPALVPFLSAASRQHCLMGIGMSGQGCWNTVLVAHLLRWEAQQAGCRTPSLTGGGRAATLNAMLKSPGSKAQEAADYLWRRGSHVICTCTVPVRAGLLLLWLLTSSLLLRKGLNCCSVGGLHVRQKPHEFAGHANSDSASSFGVQTCSSFASGTSQHHQRHCSIGGRPDVQLSRAPCYKSHGRSIQVTFLSSCQWWMEAGPVYPIETCIGSRQELTVCLSSDMMTN